MATASEASLHMKPRKAFITPIVDRFTTGDVNRRCSHRLLVARQMPHNLAEAGGHIIHQHKVDTFSPYCALKLENYLCKITAFVTDFAEVYF